MTTNKITVRTYRNTFIFAADYFEVDEGILYLFDASPEDGDDIIAVFPEGAWTFAYQGEPLLSETKNVQAE